MGLRVVIAPDSFKGSLPASQVAAALASGWSSRRPGDRVVTMPLADGGEGTLDALAAADSRARRHAVPEVAGPDSRPRRGEWLELTPHQGISTAVVELAQCSGLPLLQMPDPLGAHTLGLGQVMDAVLEHGGIQRLLVGLGGSASTDGGLGALTALGVRALDARGRDLPAGGGALHRLAALDLGGLSPDWSRLEVVLLTDVDSPLLGPGGAAEVFGPQKGADADQIELLDRGLALFAELVGGDPQRPGYGAAGGTGFGLASVLGARVEPGAAFLMQAVGLPERLASADVVITGEGRFDDTSTRGKVVGRLLEESEGLRRVVVAGQAADTARELAHDRGVQTLALSDLAGSSEQAIGEPERWLRVAGAEVASSI